MKPATYSEAAKTGLGKSILVTQLEDKAGNTNKNAIDELLVLKDMKPNCIKKKDSKLLFFSNDDERKRAKAELEKEDKKKGIKAITGQMGFYPALILGIDRTDMDELRRSIEERKLCLSGKITDLRGISQSKGHVRVNMKSNEVKDPINETCQYQDRGQVGKRSPVGPS